MRVPIVPLLSVFVVGFASNPQADRDGRLPWAPSPWFAEKSFTLTVGPGIRMHVNARLVDEQGSGEGPTVRIIFYALPNGNTIEQTLGCKMADGLDWHYDIQHVAAQTRLLRAFRPQDRIVLVCVEAAGLSWPNWRRSRPDANEAIRHFIEDWRHRLGGDDAKVTLTGHSGGGSFIFGAIEAGGEIPDYVERIVFLDANYAFDGETHGEKLKVWLEQDASRRLIVIAYDDREITLNGKRVVGPDGGTYRATGRMRDAFGQLFPLDVALRPPFQESVGLEGRIHFYVHRNPDNKILHTALVGEMNGLVHALTLGTSSESDWGKFGGPRAYTKWIQPEPTLSHAETSRSESGKELTTFRQMELPSRPAGAKSGADSMRSIDHLSLEEREADILREITSGNFPEFLRELKPVTLSGKSTNGSDVAATVFVMPDYLAVGSDADFVRIPMTPQTAQRVADHFGCTLPTRKIVDAIDAAAEVRLEPRPLTEEREAVATFVKHHRLIEDQRAGKALGALVTGIKKDIVLSPRIFEHPNRVALYGWCKLDGQSIQPLTTVHGNRYVDYSHGVRLVSDTIELDGQRRRISELLTDPDLCSIVSDEGPIDPPRYPAD